MDYSLIKNSEKLTTLVRIVAHLMGDGCVTKKYFAYYNKNQLLIDNFEKDVLNVFPKVHVTKGKVNSGTHFRMITNKSIIEFLKSILPDYRSHTLSIPSMINNRDLKKEFLRALYDDEGCVGLRAFKKTNEIKRNLTLSSNSRRLIEEIKLMLCNNFGIVSNKIQTCVKNRDEKIFTNYVLSITGKSNFEKFREKIGFVHPEKSEKLTRMIYSYKRLSATT